MAEACGLIVAAPLPVPMRIAKSAWRLRRLPLMSMFILIVFVITGIGAPWLAPHDPERGIIRERNVPRVWVGEEIRIKEVVEAVASRQSRLQISLADAQKINPGAGLAVRLRL